MFVVHCRRHRKLKVLQSKHSTLRLRSHLSYTIETESKVIQKHVLHRFLLNIVKNKKSIK